MAKKTFTERMQRAVNPTMQFISSAPEEASTEPQKRPQAAPKPKTEERASTASSAPQRAPQPRRALSQYGEELRNRRFQLLLTPSLFEELKERAAAERMSINDLVNSVMSDYLRK